MENQIKMNGRTLEQFVQELKENRCTEITRVLPITKTAYVVEFRGDE